MTEQKEDPAQIRIEETRSLIPPIQEVRMAAAVVWLGRGVQDMQACPLASLFYGFCFAGMGLTITLVFEHAYQFASAFTSGFLLLGPFLAMGLYELSRRREHGDGCRFASSLTIWRRNIANIAVFALILAVIFLIWARASLIIFALFYTNELPNLSGFLNQVLRLDNLEFLVVYTAIGGLFAALVFALSVVSIPIMLDRGQDAITAMLTSFAALSRNPGPMLLWAFLIALLTIVGFLTLHIGLIFVMPIVGHGSWHAYRALVGPQPS